MLKTLLMARKKQGPEDRHRLNRMMRLNPEFDAVMTYLCLRRAMKLTHIANEAIRRELEREGLWPITDEVRAKLRDAGLLEEG